MGWLCARSVEVTHTFYVLPERLCMDPVQLMMAAHQADATVAAQTPDQALQAAIAQSRPDLWAPLSTNPAAYPDLLGWLASTGNVEVLANLRARGYLSDDAAAYAADSAGAAGAAGAAAEADSATGEPAVDPAFSQEDPAQTEPTESAEVAESVADGGTPVDEDEAADEPDAETATGEAQESRPDDSGDEAEGGAEDAGSGEVGDEQDTEEPAEDSEGAEDAEAESLAS